MMTKFNLSDAEKADLERDGFLIRQNVFDPAELRAIAQECERLAERVTAAAKGKKHRIGSYMFERQNEIETYVKWEPDAPDLLQGIEPFRHLSEELAGWGMDPRLVHPSRAIVGQDDLMLYTEKLNLKRARRGGKYILHQDFPYWRDENPSAHRVATAMLFLDDATRENGCLEAAPGSHREGVQKMRDVEGFGALEMDPALFDHSRLVALEAKAGSVVWFGAFLVHRSLPNTSGDDRRALLYSYQPAGLTHAVDLARAAYAAAKANSQEEVFP
jgi:ectoine hydroxylase-related dioxygenase (phytanoyl-CoA dioxygenase family)